MPRGRLEIAVPEAAAADPSSFGVVNQKPAADFGGVASTTKFGNAVERGGATQQLAIYAEPPRPSSRDDDNRTEEKTTIGGRETSERGRDSSRLDLQRGEIHRAERIGAIEFAARDDAPAAHYRCYTRHCYRLPLARTSRPLFLLATYVLNRNISVPTRAIAAFAARNSKTPIREPNMPEKRERKDEKEKRDKKEKKEPVIRAERESADSSESRAAMVAGDNPTGDPDAPFRYEWGVKLAEEEPRAEASDNDNLAEKGRRYVTKRLWGVNLTQPDVEDAAAPPTSGGPGRRGAYEPRNASRVFENDDTAAAGETRGQVSSGRASDELNSATQDHFPTWFDRDSVSRVDSVTAQTTADASSPTNPQARKIMTAESKETTALDDDALEGAVSDAEISAWRSLAMKSKPAMQAILLAMQSEKMERVSIRPEAPQPKLDVRVVRSADDLAEDDKRNEQSVGYKLSSIGLKHVGSTETPSLDNYSSKKLHTASAQVHHAPRDVSADVVRRSTGSFPVSSTSAGGTARTKRPVLKAATNPEDSTEEETSDDHRQSDGQQTTDAQDLFEEKPGSSESDSSDEQTLSEFQTASSSGQKPPDAEIDLAETPSDAIADERRIKISMRQSADRASTSAQEDEFHGDRERRNFEDAYVSYDRIDSPGDEDQDASYADVGTIDPMRSTESAEEAVESVFTSATSSVFEPNAEDPSDDDDGRQYVTDGDYVRIRGDPYPYGKEHLDKWMMPVSRNLLYKPIKRQSLLPGLSSSSPRNANDAFDADEQSYDSHAVRAVMETSGSGDGASGAKNVRSRVSSRDQRVAAPDCDAADELGLRGWTEAFSRLGRAGKRSEVERGRDNASLRAYRQ